MNYGTFFKFTIILLIIITVCICVINPKMHTEIFVYNSEYKIPTQDIKLEEKKVYPTITQSPKQEIKQIEKEQPKQKIIQKKFQPKTQYDKTQTTTLPKVESTTSKETSKKDLQIEQEDEIQWNIWRSNLQNHIMKQTKMPIIEQGTIFRFTFDVDKYGKITNIQTWSQTPSYTPHAIQHIAPVIKSLQGQTILNFPNGSNRMSTQVKGGWKISSEVKYSSPKDYNDTEVIKK